MKDYHLNINQDKISFTKHNYKNMKNNSYSNISHSSSSYRPSIPNTPNRTPIREQQYFKSATIQSILQTIFVFTFFQMCF